MASCSSISTVRTPSEVGFHGAGPNVGLDTEPEHTCEKCCGRYYRYGDLAAMYAPDAKIFHRYESSAVTQAIGAAEGATFKSVGTDERGIPKKLMLVCYECVALAQGQDADFYVRKEKTGAFLRPVWHRSARDSKFVPNVTNLGKKTKRAMENIHDKIAKRRLDVEMPSTEEVVDAMTTSLAVRRGVDWVNQIAPETYLMYGHQRCDIAELQAYHPDCQMFSKMISKSEHPGIYPLQSSKWLRLAGPTQKLDWGRTEDGMKFATWHCPACVGKWTHGGNAAHRLLIAGSADKQMPGDEVFCAYIGTCLPDDKADESKHTDRQVNLEKQIQLLKGMTLVKKIGSQEVTHDVVLKAIDALNKECEDALGKMVNVVRLRSAEPETSWQFSDRQHYCEDERLSIAASGTPFLALAVAHGSVPTLTSDLLQLWIDFCASFMNMADYVPVGKAQTITYNELAVRVKRLDLVSKL